MVKKDFNKLTKKQVMEHYKKRMFQLFLIIYVLVIMVVLSMLLLYHAMGQNDCLKDVTDQCLETIKSTVNTLKECAEVYAECRDDLTKCQGQQSQSYLIPLI
jgi:hypothetical protein